MSHPTIYVGCFFSYKTVIKQMKAKSLSDDQKIQDFSSLIKTLQENLAVDEIIIGNMQAEQKKLVKDNKNLQSMNEELKNWQVVKQVLHVCWRKKLGN